MQKDFWLIFEAITRTTFVSDHCDMPLVYGKIGKLMTVNVFKITK